MNFKLKQLSYAAYISVLLCLVLGGCHDKKQKKGMPPPPEVSVLKIIPKTVSPSEEYTGRTAGILQVDVRAQVGGIILKRTYVEGSPVKKGDILFIIDPAPFQAALDQAEGTLEDSKASFEYAEKEWKRIRGLFKKKAVSAKERDEALSQFDQTRALVEQSAAAVEIAKINLGYAYVRAPITGITSKEKRTAGNLVGTGQDDNLLTQMTQFHPIYVNFSYPDSNILQLQRLTEKGGVTTPKNMSFKATLKLADGRDYLHQGYVDFTNSFINQKTGSVEARVIIDNPDAQLLPGQFVRITITGLTLKDALLIPEKAVMQGPQGTFVYKVDDQNKAHMQPVTLGIQINKEMLIENGLKAGDTIITDGMIRVHPESVIKISSDPKTPVSSALEKKP